MLVNVLLAFESLSALGATVFISRHIIISISWTKTFRRLAYPGSPHIDQNQCKRTLCGLLNQDLHRGVECNRMAAFCDKERMSGLMETIPVHVIKSARTDLLGAALAASCEHDLVALRAL